MDLNRLYRARIAGRMQAVEGRRKRFLEGKIKPKEIDASEWELIVQMDEWGRE
jgi:hypothetical protein